MTQTQQPQTPQQTHAQAQAPVQPAQPSQQEPSQPGTPQTLQPGMWIEVEMMNGGPYTAQVEKINPNGVIDLSLALYDWMTGGLLFKMAYVWPNEILYWKPSCDPRQPAATTEVNP